MSGEKITWNATLATGVPELDGHHKLLFSKLNELVAAAEHDRDRAVGEVLDFLDQYVRMHFEREEEQMACWGCPLAGKNERAHQLFAGNLAAVRAAFEARGVTPELATMVRLNLQLWFFGHVRGVDRHLRACVEQAP